MLVRLVKGSGRKSMHRDAIFPRVSKCQLVSMTTALLDNKPTNVYPFFGFSTFDRIISSKRKIKTIRRNETGPRTALLSKKYKHRTNITAKTLLRRIRTISKKKTYPRRMILRKKKLKRLNHVLAAKKNARHISQKKKEGFCVGSTQKYINPIERDPNMKISH